MPTVSQVERQIFTREGFKVQFRDTRTGRDVPGNRVAIPSYPYERMAKNRWSVTDWKQQRFNQCYPGFDARVLRHGRQVAHGRTLLSTVRDTYLPD